MLQEKKFQREAAKKASISEIQAGAFTGGPEEGAAGRVNILATIVDKDSDETTYKSMVADDGTGQIQLKIFDDGSKLFEKHEIGNLVVIVGKIRAYGGQIYIAPEIIRKTSNTLWAEVRRIELLMNAAPAAKKNPVMEEKKRENEPDAVNMDKLQIYKLTMELDAGRGADITEVIARAGKSNAEATIKEMQKAGDLFEVTPGKIKVLE